MAASPNFLSGYEPPAGHQALILQNLLDLHSQLTEGRVHGISALVLKMYAKITRELIIQPQGHLDVIRTRFLSKQPNQM